MKMTMRIVAFLAIPISIQVAYPSTYYVSPSGNNNNPGTFLLPVKSIQAGVNKAYAGDSVMVLAGTYNEHVTFPRSGADGFPITLRGEVDSEGNPLAVIDNTLPVMPLWEPAPEVGSGVYKQLGFAPTLMLWNGGGIFRINPQVMQGSSPYVADGKHVLAYPANKVWGGDILDFDFLDGLPFWHNAQVLYGVLNSDTVYVRFVDGRDPNTCSLRATTSTLPGIRLVGKSYIVIEHFTVQGSLYGIELTSSSDCNIIQHCAVRNGDAQIRVLTGCGGNIIRDNDIAFGYLDSTHWGEWSTDVSISDSIRYNGASYILSKYLDGYAMEKSLAIQLQDAGARNEICSNTIHHTSIGVLLGGGASRTRIHDNSLYALSSSGVFVFAGVESLYVYDNDIDHTNIPIRIQDVGSLDDTLRSGYFYNNRCYNYSKAGSGLYFHYDPEDTFYVKMPDFWFYHNSFAGGHYAISPRVNRCSRMKFVNNIFSSGHTAYGTREQDDTVPDLFAAFDYNFLGGHYNHTRYMDWAGRDPHNLWSVDTLDGDINHQVWPLGPEPDWVVPTTSPAFRYGLDLSQRFRLRGTPYDPLPGMQPGYFSGVAPNLGAVQNTGGGRWAEMTSLPAGTRLVKDGGWLAHASTDTRIFAARGNKTTDFFAYEPVSATWTTRAPMLVGPDGRLPRKGAVGASDGLGCVYATKGANTRVFERYDIARDSWFLLPDVPLGTSGKKVKAGADMVYVPGALTGTGDIYLLKGNKNEFWRYSTDRDSWYVLPGAPAEKWGGGSWLVFDGGHTIYAHQAKYHGFYAYDVGTNTWSAAKSGMPYVGTLGKSKKSKDGGSGAWLDGAAYALKGGNTSEFWRYSPGSDSWKEMEPMPLIGSAGKKKAVKNGADIVAMENMLYALKGSSTLEFWRWSSTADLRSCAPLPDAQGLQVCGPVRLTIAPNPVQGLAILRCAGMRSLPAEMSLFDAAGRRVMTRAVQGGQQAFLFSWDCRDQAGRSVPAGVYLARLEAPGFSQTAKLVVQR